MSPNDVRRVRLTLDATLDGKPIFPEPVQQLLQVPDVFMGDVIVAASTQFNLETHFGEMQRIAFVLLTATATDTTVLSLLQVQIEDAGSPTFLLLTGGMLFLWNLQTTTTRLLLNNGNPNVGAVVTYVVGGYR